MVRARGAMRWVRGHSIFTLSWAWWWWRLTISSSEECLRLFALPTQMHAPSDVQDSATSFRASSLRHICGARGARGLWLRPPGMASLGSSALKTLHNPGFDSLAGCAEVQKALASTWCCQPPECAQRGARGGQARGHRSRLRHPWELCAVLWTLGSAAGFFVRR